VYYWLKDSIISKGNNASINTYIGEKLAECNPDPEGNCIYWSDPTGHVDAYILGTVETPTSFVTHWYIQSTLNLDGKGEEQGIDAEPLTIAAIIGAALVALAVLFLVWRISVSIKDTAKEIVKSPVLSAGVSIGGVILIALVAFLGVTLLPKILTAKGVIA
jgi:hypothetical protein